MSYDIQIWSVRPFSGEGFLHPELWQRSSAAWTYARKNWQIVASASDKVEPEDIPEDLNKILPGIEWLCDINLEGAGTQEAEQLLRTTADRIAKSTHGAVFDPQEDTIRLPSGVKRLMLPRSKQVFEVIAMSWWALDTPFCIREGKAAFVDLLERMLPEALPKRYGVYEPPQHRYSETGKNHFVDFLQENQRDTIVWYPNRPVVYVHLGLPNPPGPHKIGFRTNHLEILVEKAVLSEPGWAKTLVNFWQQASLLVRPFYGDVRILGGHQWMGATVSSSGKESEHPVKSWWWKGIPDDLGFAVVLGDPYQRLWPSFITTGATIDGLTFASVNDWQRGGDLREKIGGPPKDQVQRIQHSREGALTVKALLSRIANLKRNPPDRKAEYASAWPFGEPFLT